MIMDNHFEPLSPEDWKQLIAKELKATPYEEVTWEIAEGVTGKPDYSSNDLPPPAMYIPEDRTPEGWLIKSSLRVTDFNASNKAAHQLLMQGVNAFRFRGQISRYEDLQTLFEGIELPHIGVFFSKQQQPLQFLQHLRDYLRNNNYPTEIARGGMAFDPIGTLATRGNWINNELRDRELFYHLVNTATESNLYQFHSILVDGSIYHNSGADVVTELACTLAHGNEYLHWLYSGSREPKKSAAQLFFKIAAGRNYFANIAKLRAFRPLWANVCSAYDISPRQSKKVFVSAETSRRERNLSDRYTNLIRTTTQAMSAVVGGCNSLHVIPFDAGWPDSGNMGARLARNIQLILKEESFLGAVADPALGSYAIDRLTSEIMHSAWNKFCEIEDAGGFSECLKSGMIQTMINRQAEASDSKIANGESVFVGLNKYLVSDEKWPLENVKKKSAAFESQQIEPLPLRTAFQAYQNSQTPTANEQKDI